MQPECPEQSKLRRAGGRRERPARHRRDGAGRSQARQSEGVEELATLSLTAVGPPDNPGILSEINLSARSC